VASGKVAVPTLCGQASHCHSVTCINNATVSKPKVKFTMRRGRGIIKATSMSRKVSIKDTIYTAGGRTVRSSSLLNPTRLRAKKNQNLEAERLRLLSMSQVSKCFTRLIQSDF
jgi:hypothetical protein